MEDIQDRGSASDVSEQRYGSYLYVLVACIGKIAYAYGDFVRGTEENGPEHDALFGCARKLRRDWGMAELKPWQSSLLDCKAWEAVLADLEEIAGAAETVIYAAPRGAVWSRESEAYRMFAQRLDCVLPAGRGCAREALGACLDLESLQLLPGERSVAEIMNGLLVIVGIAETEVLGRLTHLAAAYRSSEREGGRSSYRDRPRGEGRYERGDRESRYDRGDREGRYERGGRYGDRPRGDRPVRSRYASRDEAPAADAEEERRAMLREQSEAEARFRDREAAPVRKSYAEPAPMDGPAPDCPICGAVMELRTIRHGERAGRRFWGCPDYPRCRGTRDAE